MTLVEWIDALTPRVILLFGFALGASAAMVGHGLGLLVAKAGATLTQMREADRPSSLPRERR